MRLRQAAFIAALLIAVVLFNRMQANTVRNEENELEQQFQALDREAKKTYGKHTRELRAAQRAAKVASIARQAASARLRNSKASTEA